MLNFLRFLYLGIVSLLVSVLSLWSICRNLLPSCSNRLLKRRKRMVTLSLLLSLSLNLLNNYSFVSVSLKSTTSSLHFKFYKYTFSFNKYAIMGILDTAWNIVSSPFKYGHDLVKAYTGVSGVEAQKQANEYNLQAVRETNELNKELYYDQKDENRYLREQEMEYDSAPAQVQRLKDAGLNPILAMYQGVNAGSVGSSSAPSPTPMQAPHMSPVDYSPMASAIGNTFSLLSMINPIADSLAGAKFAGARAADSAKSLSSRAAIDANNLKISDEEVEIAKARRHIVNEELKQQQFKTTLDDLYQKVVVANQDAFEKSVLAELKSKVSGKNLTEQQIKMVYEQTLAAKLENESIGATKKQIWSIVNEFVESHISELKRIAHLLGKKSSKIWDMLF